MKTVTPWILLGLIGLIAGWQPGMPETGEPDEPTQQGTIFVLGFVDVTGGGDPDCPHCNLEFDSDDEAYARSYPLEAFTVRLLDGEQEIGRFQSELLDVVHRVQIPVEIPDEGERWIVELVAPPPGWALCENQTAARSVVADDFQLGSTRLDFFFSTGCPPGSAPATPQPLATLTPGDPATIVASPSATSSITITQVATPDASATVDVSPTPIGTPTLLPSPTPEITLVPTWTPLPPSPTVTPSVTPIAIPNLPGPPAIPTAILPGPLAPQLEAELAGLLGGGADPLVDLSADRLAAYWRGSVWLLGLEAGQAVTLGKMPLRSGPRAVSQIRLLDDRVVLAEERQATVIDVGQPAAPQLLAELPLPASLRLIDGEADRIYLLAGGVPGHVAWLDIFEIGDDGRPRALARHSLGAVHVLDMQAGSGLLGLTVRETVDQSAVASWQIFDVADPTRLLPAGLPDSESWMMDLAGRRLLTRDDTGLHVYDLSQPAQPIEIGGWDPGAQGVQGAFLAGQELRAWRRAEGEAGQDAGATRLWRIARGADSRFRALDEARLEGRPILAAEGSVCAILASGLDCRKASWLASRVEWPRVHPDAEAPVPESCQSASRVGVSFLLVCLDTLVQLDIDAEGMPRVTGTQELTSRLARFIEFGERRYLHGADGQLRLLRPGPAGWTEEETGIFGWWIAADGDRLLSLNTGGAFALRDRFDIYAADDHRRIGALDLDFEVYRRLQPVLAGDHLLVHRSDLGWWRIDLSDPSTPRPAEAFGNFAPFGMLAQGPIGYAILPDQAQPRLSVEVLGLDGDSPRPLGRVELDLAGGFPRPPAYPRAWIAGPLLWIDVGAGQLARLDIRNPLFPRLLTDLPGDTLEFEAAVSGDRLLRLSGGPTMDVLSTEVDATAGQVLRWRAWGLGKGLSSLTVLDDLALSGPGSGGDESAWLYGLEDPTSPRRRAHLPIADWPAPLRSGSWLYAVGLDGMALLVYEPVAGMPPQLRGRWCVVDDRCAQENPNRAILGLAGRDGLLYLSLRSGELIELDARDPAAIRPLAIHRLPEDARGPLLVAGDVLGASLHPLVLLDVSRPGQLQPIGRLTGLPDGSSYLALGRAGELIWSAGEAILFIDLSQPALPRLRARLDLPDAVHRLSADGERLLAATGGEQLWLIDAPSGAAPRALGWLSQRGSVRAAGRDGTIYVANNRRGEIEVWSDPRPVDRRLERIWLPFQILQRFGRGAASESGLFFPIEP